MLPLPPPTGSISSKLCKSYCNSSRSHRWLDLPASLPTASIARAVRWGPLFYLALSRL